MIQDKEAVQHTIDKQICNDDKPTWSPAEDKHGESEDKHYIQYSN